MSTRDRLAVAILFAAIYFVSPALPPRRVLAQSPSGIARSAQTGSPPGTGVQQEQLDAMKADLARMRAILGQMQNNIGFVGTTTTPLHHQFSLEIEMWQVLITQMERRVDLMEKANRPQQ
jgi:hypothetical protein